MMTALIEYQRGLEHQRDRMMTAKMKQQIIDTAQDRIEFETANGTQK